MKSLLLSAVLTGAPLCAVAYAETQELTPLGGRDITTAMKEADKSIYISYGQLLRRVPGRRYDTAYYQVTRVIGGRFPTNEIRVVYASNSLHGALPQDAILILNPTPFMPNRYRAIGGEAWRGILPNTEENRRHILALSAEELSATPSGKTLSKRDCLAIAQQALVQHGDDLDFVEYTTTRKPFGWLVGVYATAAANADISISRMIRISDTGEVLSYRKSKKRVNKFFKTKPWEESGRDLQSY